MEASLVRLRISQRTIPHCSPESGHYIRSDGQITDRHKRAASTSRNGNTVLSQDYQSFGRSA